MTRYGLNDFALLPRRYRCRAGRQPCVKNGILAGLAGRTAWIAAGGNRWGDAAAAIRGRSSALAAAFAALDDWRLCVLVRAAQLGGSAVLGLAFAEGAIEASDLHSLAFLDELWQAEKWGQDDEAAAPHRYRRRTG